ncbi:MAG: tyrosine-type recombinase/integrase [Chloroflexota bacterium]
MKTGRPKSHIYAPNVQAEPISNEDIIRSFLLSLGGSGRVERTLETYGQALRMLVEFAKREGLPALVEMEPDHLRYWLQSLYKRGNKASSVSVRYRALNRFYRWAVREGELDENPLAKVDPPRIPDEIQPWYRPEEVEKVLRAVGREPGVKAFEYRDTALILTLYDAGPRAAEVCGMKVSDIDWKHRTVLVMGKAGKQRRISIGARAAEAIDRYLRRRGVKSDILWLAKGTKSFTTNGLRMMLERRFKIAEVQFRGAHAFRRGFAMSYLAAGGQEGDLKELGGWESYAMVSRYARGNAAERAVDAHKKFSPGDRLNVH